MKYTNKDAVQDYIGTEIDTNEFKMTNRYIDAMTSFIDKETNHFPLVAGTEAQTRSYVAGSTGNCVIDNIAIDSITSVSVNGTVVTEFEIPSSYGDGGNILYEKNIYKGSVIEVVGIFGKYKTVPSDIELACSIMVGAIVDSSQSEGKHISSETIGRYTVSFSTKKREQDIKMAKMILSDFRKISVISM